MREASGAYCVAVIDAISINLTNTIKGLMPTAAQGSLDGGRQTICFPLAALPGIDYLSILIEARRYTNTHVHMYGAIWRRVGRRKRRATNRQRRPFV